MLRHAAAAALAVCLSVAPAVAQNVTFTVNAAAADVYKSPSTGGVVIGRVPRGRVLPVTRELGSWVRIPWPDAPDGVGFVHVSRGIIGRGGPPEPTQSVRAAVQATEASIYARQPASIDDAAPAVRQVTRRRQATPVPHIVGVGGGLVSGSPLGVGATARAWRDNRFGLRLDLSRYAAPTLPTGTTSVVQIEPSVLVSLMDHVTDYFWLRPYLGSGVSLRRQASDNSIGFQAFGGLELTHASAPQLALSADLGYRSRQPAFGEGEAGRFRVSLSAHWYIK